eukprot:TRINITY_DN952_c0_g2_i3.p1 TRINITY_DN952_c0_g2~~TRINITY_DN952_c0_g2_i3.p1  ORF type:complete len:523 (-),score=-15.89 TRINITY_DN952_c0_g2_i3:357-1925(-)
MPYKYSKSEQKEAEIYLSTGKVPAHRSNTRDITNFKKKWDGFRPDQWTRNGKKLIWVEDVTDFLINYYDDPLVSFRGTQTMFHAIKKKYIGVSSRDIGSFLGKNQTNQQHKPRPKVKPSRPRSVGKPFQRLQMDLVIIRPKNKKFIAEGEVDKQVVVLTVIDEFTKYAYARICRSKSAKSVLAQVKNVVRSIPEALWPRIIQTDNGLEFKNKTMAAYLASQNIKQTYGRTYTPTDQAMIERFNGTLKNMLSKYSSHFGFNFFDFPHQRIINKIMKNYNGAYHSTIRTTPIELYVAARRTNGSRKLSKAKEAIERRARKQTAKNNKKFEPIEVGDHVRLSNDTDPAFRKSMVRGYMQQYGSDIYKVYFVSKERPDKAQQYRVKTFRSANRPTGRRLNKTLGRGDLQKIDPEVFTGFDGDDHIAVDKVLDVRGRGRNKEYLVSQVGKPASEHIWVQESDSFAGAIAKFRSIYKYMVRKIYNIHKMLTRVNGPGSLLGGRQSYRERDWWRHTQNPKSTLRLRQMN